MKKKQNKEQVIAVITLSAIFGLFIFLKINPEQYDVSKLNEKVENEILNVAENKLEELIDETNEIELSIEDVSSELVEKKVIESVKSFTDKELERAQKYAKRRWAPDNTINIAAWEHVKKIKIIKEIDPKLAVEKLNTNSQIVSSSN